jgi:hypothetical protein
MHIISVQIITHIYITAETETITRVRNSIYQFVKQRTSLVSIDLCDPPEKTECDTKIFWSPNQESSDANL